MGNTSKSKFHLGTRVPPRVAGQRTDLVQQCQPQCPRSAIMLWTIWWAQGDHMLSTQKRTRPSKKGIQKGIQKAL